MLKKLLAPMLFTSVLVIAGCNSDEASQDLENADDIEIDEGGQKEGDTSEGSSEETKQDPEGTDEQSSEDQSSDGQAGDEKSASEQDGQDQQDSTQEQSKSNDTSNEENQGTEQQNSADGSSGSGGPDQNTSNSSESNGTTQASGEQSYTFNEVNGEAVNVIQGINAVEIKRQNLNGAKATSAVAIKAGGKQINLTYNEERDSFRNYQIKDVELEQLRQATVIIQG